MQVRLSDSTEPAEVSLTIRLKPRVLVDVSNADTSVTLFGEKHPYPILLAPTAAQKLTHSEGEVATVRGAGATGTTMVMSTFSNTSLEDAAAIAKSPLWLQLYAQTEQAVTAARTPRTSPMAGLAGVLATLVTRMAPEAPSTETMSVKVPPVSMPIRKRGSWGAHDMARPLPRRCRRPCCGRDTPTLQLPGTRPFGIEKQYFAMSPARVYQTRSFPLCSTQCSMA